MIYVKDIIFYLKSQAANWLRSRKCPTRTISCHSIAHIWNPVTGERVSSGDCFDTAMLSPRQYMPGGYCSAAGNDISNSRIPLYMISGPTLWRCECACCEVCRSKDKIWKLSTEYRYSSASSAMSQHLVEPYYSTNLASYLACQRIQRSTKPAGFVLSSIIL